MKACRGRSAVRVGGRTELFDLGEPCARRGSDEGGLGRWAVPSTPGWVACGTAAMPLGVSDLGVGELPGGPAVFAMMFARR
jgi:hypothetical protein